MKTISGCWGLGKGKRTSRGQTQSPNFVHFIGFSVFWWAQQAAPLRKNHVLVGVNLVFTLATGIRPINLEIRFWVARELRVENGNEISRRNVSFEMMDNLPTVELEINKRQNILLGLFLLVVAIGYALMPNIVPYAWLRWGIFVFFLANSSWFLLDVLIGHPYLKLADEGIETRTLFRTRKIRWLDIASMGAYEKKGNRFLGFNYIQGRAPKNTSFNRNLFGYDDTFANSSTLKFEKFRYLVISYWQHAKQAQALELSKEAINPRLKTD
jgi:Bacterial PH domain